MKSSQIHLGPVQIAIAMIATACAVIIPLILSSSFRASHVGWAVTGDTVLVVMVSAVIWRVKCRVLQLRGGARNNLESSDENLGGPGNS